MSEVGRPEALGNLLLRALSNEQFQLLLTIVEPVIAPHLAGGMGTWPAWEWVGEQFERHCPQADALTVLKSLPSVPGLASGVAGMQGRCRYGLVWRADNHTPDPTVEERVGLSIAGFFQLHLAGRTPQMAHALLEVLSGFARIERNSVPSDVTGPSSKDLPLADHTGWFTKSTQAKPYVVPLEVVAHCLQQEYFPVSLRETQSGWLVRLGGRRWRPYLDFEEDVERYLDKVAAAGVQSGATQSETGVELPPLVAPVRRLAFENLHAQVQSAAGPLFADGHYASAISEAFKSIEVRVKRETGIDQSGAKLMATAFHPSNPALNVAAELGQSGQDEREGFHALFRGAMIGIRNPPKPTSYSKPKTPRVPWNTSASPACSTAVSTKPWKAVRSCSPKRRI